MSAASDILRQVRVATASAAAHSKDGGEADVQRCCDVMVLLRDAPITAKVRGLAAPQRLSPVSSVQLCPTCARALTLAIALASSRCPRASGAWSSRALIEGAY